ncbi:MAG: hypothetical protein HY319_17335 [Armatimonadetes bacterium]|nr:hypothetical protein [Armatimonadota bacterium]
MPLASRDYCHEWSLPDGRIAVMRPAMPADVPELRALYYNTYGDRYTLPEVMEDRKTEAVLTGPGGEWLLTECEGSIVASLLYGLEPGHRLGKTFGGVVMPALRGQKVMKVMLRESLDLLLGEEGPFDLVYAVVRTFVSLSFHRDLADLGFVDVGVFPNVRKVQQYETHGFKVCLSPGALESRRRGPQLIPQIFTLYQIVRKKLGLEPARVDPRLSLRPVQAQPRVRLEERRATEERIDFLQRTTRNLQFGFFPLHEPNLVLSDPGHAVRVFLFTQPKDGHASILGLTRGDYDTHIVLASVADYCEAMGAAYLELLVPAFDPELQAQAYRAGFLPCAYFPAAFLDRQGKRHDVVVTSKTFVPLHFSGLKLSEETKPFLLEYFKLYTARLWEELMDA